MSLERCRDSLVSDSRSHSMRRNQKPDLTPAARSDPGREIPIAENPAADMATGVWMWGVSR